MALQKDSKQYLDAMRGEYSGSSHFDVYCGNGAHGYELSG
jgi:hypothetical protein